MDFLKDHLQGPGKVGQGRNPAVERFLLSSGYSWALAMAQELRGATQNKVVPSLEGLDLGRDRRGGVQEALAESRLREASAELGRGSQSETLLG